MSEYTVKFGALDTGLQATLKNTRRDITGVGTDSKKAAQEVGSSFDDMKSAAMNVGKAFLAAFAFTKIVSGVKGLINDIDELGKTSTRLRLPVGEVQTLQAAAETAGTSIETIVRSMERAQVAATEAGRGTERYKEEFAALNINLGDFQKMDHAGRLRMIAQAYSTATDKGEAYSSLTKVLGRGVGELLPLLEGGAAGIDDISNSIAKLDDADVKAVEALNDSFELFKTSIKTAAMQIIVDLRPALEKLMEGAKAAGSSVKSLADYLKFGTIQTGESLGEVILMMKEIEKHEKNASWYGTRRLENLKERVSRMPEELVFQAKIAQEVEKLSDLYSSGAISKEELIRRSREIRNQQSSYEEMTKSAKEAEEAEKLKAIEARAAAEAAADYAKESEKAEKALDRLLPKLQEKLGKIDELPDQLMAVAEAISEVFNSMQVSTLEELNELLEKTTDPQAKLEIANSLNNLIGLMDRHEKIEGQITAEKKRQQDANDKLEAQAKRAQQDADKLLELEKARTIARQNLEVEIMLLKMEKEGRKELADGLREEIELRKKAKEIAKDGLDENWVLKRLKEEAGLRKEIADNAEREKDAVEEKSKIMRSDRDIAKELGIDPFGFKTRKELREAIEEERERLKREELEKEKILLDLLEEEREKAKAAKEENAKENAKADDQMKEDIKEGVKHQDTAAKTMEKIRTAVDSINRLVGIIEPKLPTPSLV
jgi:hypothetical protein